MGKDPYAPLWQHALQETRQQQDRQVLAEADQVRAALVESFVQGGMSREGAELAARGRPCGAAPRASGVLESIRTTAPAPGDGAGEDLTEALAGEFREWGLSEQAARLAAGGRP